MHIPSRKFHSRDSLKMLIRVVYFVPNKLMILLQVGQAGLQTGQLLLDKLYENQTSKSHIEYPLNLWNQQLAIDTERKVQTKAELLIL